MYLDSKYLLIRGLQLYVFFLMRKSILTNLKHKVNFQMKLDVS